MTEEGIDESLYSRQIYVLGVEAMKKMANASVLISGLGGLGVEIAKNIILMGVHSVTVHDTKAAEISDLASNFYLTEQDIGKNRAEASVSKLAELNVHVLVKASTEELTEEYIKQFNTVCITDSYKMTELLRISEICRKEKIYFIATQISGLFGYVFDDFGEKFNVSDPRGEIPTRFMIEYITKAKESVVTVAEGGLHGLTDGDLVRFEEVEGMTELNDHEFPIKVITANKFSIGDTSEFHEYLTGEGSGGYGNQIFPPACLDFVPFKQALDEAPVLDSDFTHWGRDRHTIVAFLAAAELLDEGKEVNEENLLEQAKKFVAAHKFCDDLDEDLVKIFARQHGIAISPMAAVFGGIVGQEILKSLSGKFLPIKQFFSLAYVEAIPSEVKFTLQNDRYDPYRRIFGDAQQEKMMNLKYFMIGAGAIGCEVLKNWAMMGVSAGKDGKLTVTDMDTIERSNLSRQFLFRDSDIGKSKSETAAKAAVKMNSSLKIEPQTHKLAEETRDIYSDKFYMDIDGVCNALDNIEARFFSDKLCVYYGKPLLESGTLGPKANYQIVVPSLTENYGASTDAPEVAIPQCTVHNYPSNSEHACEWARDIFSGIFEQPPVSANKFAADPESFITEAIGLGGKSALSTLITVRDALVDVPQSFEDCVKWARRKFSEYFEWRIEDLLAMYPVDHVTPSGAKFWSGSKRAPSPIKFDSEDPLHVELIDAAARIHARIYGIADVMKKEEIARVAAAADPGERPPAENEEATVADDDPRIAEVAEELRKLKPTKLNPEKFEKDDDSNGHIDFIYAATNLRCVNYRIKTESKLEVKRIAGKIIPAIATTTAMICGFVALEMYKVHCVTPKKLEDFRNGFINLAIDMFALSEPIECAHSTLGEGGPTVSIWDKLMVKGDLTVEQFMQTAEEKWGLTVTGMTIGTTTIMAKFFSKMKKAQRMNRKISELYAELSKTVIPDSQLWLRIDCVTVKGKENVDAPPFILAFRE